MIAKKSFYQKNYCTKTFILCIKLRDFKTLIASISIRKQQLTAPDEGHTGGSFSPLKNDVFGDVGNGVAVDALVFVTQQQLCSFRVRQQYDGVWRDW